MRRTSWLRTFGGSAVLVSLVSLISTLGCDTGANQDHPTSQLEQLSAEPSWTTYEATEIVRLPGGDLELCDDRVTSVADCPAVQGLDPAWPIARVLHVYPYIDPEAAAEAVWTSARKRMMFEYSGDERMWSPDWLPDRLVAVDKAAARVAEIWGSELHRYHLMEGYRDLVAWRREYFKSLQEEISQGEPGAAYACDEQNRILGYVAFCELTEFIWPEWTVERVIEEYDGFGAADTMDILQIFWVDVRDHRLAAGDPPLDTWSSDDLEEKLDRLSMERQRARARLLASGEFGFLAARVESGRPEVGRFVGECVDSCERTGESGAEALEKEQACEEECYSRSYSVER